MDTVPKARHRYVSWGCVGEALRCGDAPVTRYTLRRNNSQYNEDVIFLNRCFRTFTEHVVVMLSVNLRQFLSQAVYFARSHLPPDLREAVDLTDHSLLFFAVSLYLFTFFTTVFTFA